MRALSALGWKSTRDLDEVAAVFDTFKDPAARHAIRHVVRAVVDWRGQIVTMADRAYLTEEMPMWVVWGRDDRVIPVRHASHAARFAPSSRVEVIPDAGPLPAQGPPLPVQPDRPRLHPLDRAGEVLPGPVPGAAEERHRGHRSGAAARGRRHLLTRDAEGR